MSIKYDPLISPAPRVEDLPKVSATALKHSTADVLDQVAAGQPVAITRHDKPRAVLLSVEQYRSGMGAPSDLIAELAAEYQGMLDEMQKPEQKAAAKRLFEATSEELGEAAVRGAARKFKYQLRP